MSAARIAVVTGTGTGVGKTVATAALTVWWRQAGQRVAVVKPVQSGVGPVDPGDVDDVRRLAGEVETHELMRLEHPLAPDVAARVAGVTIPPIARHASKVAELALRGDLDVVLVEGAGGLLVRLDAEGGTVADLAVSLAAEYRLEAELWVVTTAGLGSLNHAELTVEAARRRGLSVAGLMVGAYPADPDLASRLNLGDLPAVTSAPLRMVLPEGSGSATPAEFQELVSRACTG